MLSGHPWIYRDAIDPLPPAGTAVAIFGRDGKRYLGRGMTDEGPIGVRMWTTRDEAIDGALIRARVAAATELRRGLLPADTNAYRLIHGEGDRMPGVVCDVYGSHAVVVFDGHGGAALAELVFEALGEVLADLGVTTLLRRSRADGGAAGPAVDLVFGESPAEPVVVREHGMVLPIDLGQGQKTGFFVDHRESRYRLRSLSHGRTVLNLYGYTGAFSIAAGLGGADEVLTVDLAAGALELAARGWTLNGLDENRHRTLRADVTAVLNDPKLLEQTNEGGTIPARFDIVIADPPNFAPRSSAVESAERGYRTLHASALSRVRDGGFYLAASCSTHVDRARFEATLRDGAQMARRSVQVLEQWGAPFDHPRLVAFPEGDYLKVFLCRVLT